MALKSIMLLCFAAAASTTAYYQEQLAIKPRLASK